MSRAVLAATLAYQKYLAGQDAGCRICRITVPEVLD